MGTFCSQGSLSLLENVSYGPIRDLITRSQGKKYAACPLAASTVLVDWPLRKIILVLKRAKGSTLRIHIRTVVRVVEPTVSPQPTGHSSCL